MNEHRELLIEAEHFDDLGGWTLDTEFVQTMGSPYLMAHGLGEPVAAAKTSIRLPGAGSWRVWVRTLDWVGRWHASGAPGRFAVHINDRPLQTVFGTKGADWHWQDGGIVQIEQPEITLALHDLTGFNGRCDAILFRRDPTPVPPAPQSRPGPVTKITNDGTRFDLVVVGGGYAGMAAALSAARRGLKVALVQDRPVLGGNASSEIRVPLRGLLPDVPVWPSVGSVMAALQYDADPDARRAGPEDDIRLETLLRNEPNLTLIVNHCLTGVEMEGRRICAVHGVCTRRPGTRRLAARLFADCTGHGTLGAMAGADFMLGACDDAAAYTASRDQPVMGMTNKWFWRMTDRPRTFPETPWALDLEVADIPERAIHKQWCWESGFYRHPIDDLEAIRDWNLRAVLGAWNALKNKHSENAFAKAELISVAAIGGPRESRRLTGDYVLSGEDMIKRRQFDDGWVPVSWFLDRHVPEPSILPKFPDDPFLAVAIHQPGTAREDRPRHGKPWTGIPYRCLYSRNTGNLFMAGRNISTTYWALGAVRVMRTCGMMGEVVGAAAAVCAQRHCTPREACSQYLAELKHQLAERA